MRGGKRKGAGRKKGYRKRVTKVQKSIRIDSDVDEWLRDQQSQAEIIDEALRSAKDAAEAQKVGTFWE